MLPKSCQWQRRGSPVLQHHRQHKPPEDYLGMPFPELRVWAWRGAARLSSGLRWAILLMLLGLRSLSAARLACGQGNLITTNGHNGNARTQQVPFFSASFENTEQVNPLALFIWRAPLSLPDMHVVPIENYQLIGIKDLYGVDSNIG